MHYTGQVWRPPFEADSMVLEVTEGCSHNGCTFCTMYQGTPFRVSPIEQIEADLKEARAYYRRVKRIFLANADPFVLSGARLAEIAERIIHYFPEVETIAMYASVKNIPGKTDQELRALRALRINELNIGVESGLDEVLTHLNKGFTLAQARTQLKRLNAAGIDFSANIITGAAGMEKSMENAIASAELMNEVKPYLIFLATMHIDFGSGLYRELEAGSFIENTLGQNLREEIAFLEHLHLENTIFFGLHTSNVVPVIGELPQDQEALLKDLREGMNSFSAAVLDSRPNKGYQGAAIIR
jgi:radical SAM superfamily enzyme YgiQ (UPF0313 family)